MAYDEQDPNNPAGITDPNNPSGVYPPPTPPPTAPPPAAPPPQGGYDLEKFRKAWYGQGDVNNVQGWLDQHKDITSGVTIKNGQHAYDPSGKYIADLIGNLNDPTQKKHAQFLDGIGSNGKPRPKKIIGRPISPPGPGNLPPGGGGAGGGGGTGGAGTSVAPIRDPRLDALYNQLLERSNQSLNVNRNDPIIRAQADAFSANQERSRRNYLSDLAESSGPNSNLRNEQRLTAEKAGQATGGFEAELMGRELSTRRQEISDALNSRQGLLTEEQRLALTNKLHMIDDATRRLGIQTQDKQYYAGLNQSDRHFGQDLDYRNRALNQNDDQFRDRLGFDYGDRSNYWDAINRGTLGG